MVERVVIHADGASRGNPGQSAIGATIKDEQGRLLATVSRRVGRATNNQAEYRAVIAALEEAGRLGARRVKLYLDSELVVKQLRGEYRVKKEGLKPLFRLVKELERNLDSLHISHIPRWRNKEADALANRAF